MHFTLAMQFVFPKVIQTQAIPGMCTIFMDGLASGIAAIVIANHPITQQVSLSSAHRVELHAVIMAFTYVSSHPFNLYTESKYMLTVFMTIETGTFGSTPNSTLLQQFFFKEMKSIYFR